MDRVSPLAQADAEAYSEVLRASAAERGVALGRASEVPLAVAEAARATSELGTELSAAGDPKLRGEAIAAAILGEAAARVAAVLVEMNLASDPGDARIRRAREHAEAAQHAARRAAEGR
jgi:formiminotetrahydrofolate cyclodeaminase